MSPAPEYPGSEIYRLFTENGITHPDDMSGIIIRELYKYLWK